MAKSSRSKIKRANRAIKRDKNSKKEITKLEKVVELAKESVAAQDSKKIYTVLGGDVKEEEMVVDGAEPQTTLTEETEELPMGVAPRKSTGNFPIWMNKRAIKRAKSAEKKKAKQKNKGKRAGGRPWRK